MARNTEITFAQVAQIADAMKAAGHRPTARAVRERIGSGSMGTIHRLIQQYNGQTQTEETEAQELPENIAKALMDFVQTEIATACEPISALLIEQKAEAAALAEENERLEHLIERIGHEREQAHRNHGIAVALHNEARATIEQLNTELDTALNNNSEIGRELDRASRQIEMLASYAPELSFAKEALAKSEAARQEKDKEAAVLAAKLEASELRADDLFKRVAKIEVAFRESQNQADTANKHYQACAARLEEAARTIDELRKKAPSLPKKAAPAKTKPTATAKS